MDAAARGCGINPRSGEGRESLHGRRLVAFVGATHEPISQPEGGDDFRGGGQERDDPQGVVRHGVGGLGKVCGAIGPGNSPKLSRVSLVS